MAFLGTPPIAVPVLQALQEAGYEVPLVVSGPDRRRGRGGKTTPTAVKAAALELGLTVSDDIAELVSAHHQAPIDLAIVVAFGQLIRRPVLEQIPMVNIHFSPLPRWRGAAPVERAILAGDTETAVAIMSIVEALDEGDIWATVPVPIAPTDTLHGLWESMSHIGAEVLVQTMKAGFTNPEPQTGDPVYARKLDGSDRQIDWTASAEQVGRVVRVGGAWTVFDGERFKVHEVEVLDASSLERAAIEDLVVGTSDGSIRLVTVQPAGKPRMDASAWANGAQPDGKSFSSELA